ncbi:hypothetical protein [Nannocystis radixulma]|uniref:Uncharacterized protein n=1 Tax=Nannocystis radixulma TaxID=2995305 RepID=A0ABT5BRJ4_9BACT|nr:hypothetical protein [Nannocystis radixulma]MDC0675607.1 hypothetical protein [Nannocystis radixulma]
MANSPLLVLLLAGSFAPPTDEVTTGAGASASPTGEAATASAPAEPVAASPEPAAPAEPLDTEVPEPSGMGLQLREYRHIEAITGLDLEGAWESYEDDVREDGLTESFTAYARRRFRIRRNIGIGVTCWGIAALAPATYFWVEASRTELYQGQGLLAFAGTATAAVAVGAIVTGAVLWSRFAAPLRDLRDAGLAARGRPAFAPLPLPRGLGLGLQLAF